MCFTRIWKTVICFMSLSILGPIEIISQSYDYCPDHFNGNICVSKPNSKRYCDAFENRWWYTVVPECKTYAEALEHCTNLKRGNQLSNIRSMEQLSFLAKLTCAENEPWWAGPKQDTIEREEYKNPNKQVLPFRYPPGSFTSRIYRELWRVGDLPWAIVEPDLNFACTVFGWKGHKVLSTYPCTSKLKFICESSIAQADCNFEKSDGNWGGWSLWTNCSKISCENGEKSRSRYCNNPHPNSRGKECEGYAKERANCTMSDCAVHSDISGSYSLIMATKSNLIWIIVNLVSIGTMTLIRII